MRTKDEVLKKLQEVTELYQEYDFTWIDSELLEEDPLTIISGLCDVLIEVTV